MIPVNQGQRSLRSGEISLIRAEFSSSLQNVAGGGAASLGHYRSCMGGEAAGVGKVGGGDPLGKRAPGHGL